MFRYIPFRESELGRRYWVGLARLLHLHEFMATASLSSTTSSNEGSQIDPTVATPKRSRMYVSFVTPHFRFSTFFVYIVTVQVIEYCGPSSAIYRPQEREKKNMSGTSKANTLFSGGLGRGGRIAAWAVAFAGFVRLL